MTTAVEVQYDPFDPGFLRDPSRFWANAQANGPVFYYEPLDFWVITTYDAIRDALHDTETFSSHALGFVPPPADLADKVPKDLFIRNSIGAMDPPVHGPTRKAIAKLFTPARVKGLEETIRKTANQLIDGFEHNGTCELVHDYCLPLSLHGIVKLLGFPPEDGPLFLQWSEDHMALLFPQREVEAPAQKSPVYHISEEERHERWTSLIKAFEYYSAAIADRRARPRDDGLSALIAAETLDGEAELTERVMLRCQELVAAGHDTTANLLAMLVLFLNEAPREWQRVCAEPALIRNVVEEGLRRHGTVRGMFRVTTKEVTVEGVSIPARNLVFVAMQAAGHDASHFDCPARFDVGRENAREHLSFGSGPHLCVGAGTARLEARVGLEVLLERLPNLTVRSGQELEFAPNLVTSNLRRLEVVW